VPSSPSNCLFSPFSTLTPFVLTFSFPHQGAFQFPTPPRLPLLPDHFVSSFSQSILSGSALLFGLLILRSFVSAPSLSIPISSIDPARITECDANENFELSSNFAASFMPLFSYFQFASFPGTPAE